MVCNFEEDINFFYMNLNKLYVKYNDNSKSYFEVKDGKIQLRDFYFTFDDTANVTLGREVLMIKEIPHLIYDIEDNET